MRAAKVQASLCISAVSPEPPLLAHTNMYIGNKVNKNTPQPLYQTIHYNTVLDIARSSVRPQLGSEIPFPIEFVNVALDIA